MQTRAKVVVAYLDGRRLKGYTNDFSPVRDQFFLFPEGEDLKPVGRGIPVRIADLKALFFVKDFAGNPVHKGGPDAAPLPGRKVEIIFADDERLVGCSVAYNPKSLGFFMQPADSTSNNERMFIVNRNVKQAKVL